MNKKLTAITAGAALLVVAALLAIVAVASPAPAQASGEAMPAVKVKDTGDAFIIRWTVPAGVEPTQQLVEAWTDDGYGRSRQHPLLVPGRRRTGGRGFN